jgi:hypothetical protein
MHRNEYRVVVLALQLGSHVPHRHVQRRLGRSIRGEAVFHFTKVTLRARVAGHEDNGANGDIGLKQFLGCDNGSDGIGVEVECELIKGAASTVS